MTLKIRTWFKSSSLPQTFPGGIGFPASQLMYHKYVSIYETGAETVYVCIYGYGLMSVLCCSFSFISCLSFLCWWRLLCCLSIFHAVKYFKWVSLNFFPLAPYLFCLNSNCCNFCCDFEYYLRKKCLFLLLMSVEGAYQEWHLKFSLSEVCWLSRV